MKVLFVHHSIGRYCIKHGLRSQLALLSSSIDLWDLDYQRYGLHDGRGERVRVPQLVVPNDNTNPDGLQAFIERLLADNPESRRLAAGFDALILKSCYTGARIRSDATLQLYADAGLSMIDELERRKYPALIVTPVPDSPFYSSTATASRAIEYARRLSAAAEGKQFIRVVNLHESVADEKGFLRRKLRRALGVDAHPNNMGIRLLSGLICEGILGFLDAVSLRPLKVPDDAEESLH